MATERSSWDGKLSGLRSNTTTGPTIDKTIDQSSAGTSGTFLAEDSTGAKWWVKPLNNTQSPRVVVIETIVAGAGHILGAPVCETAVVTLTEDVCGFEFRPGSMTKPGLAHACRNVDGAGEIKTLLHREDDHNRSRHAGVFALWDWCWGDDGQWLYSATADNKLFSHDHGLYFPGGIHWTKDSLEQHVDETHHLAGPINGIDGDEVARLADRLRNVTDSELVEVLRNIPMSWPVTDEELETVGWFLQHRAVPVADRLGTI